MQEPLPRAAVCTGEHTCGPLDAPGGRVAVSSLQLMDKARRPRSVRVCVRVSCCGCDCTSPCRAPVTHRVERRPLACRRSASPVWKLACCSGVTVSILPSWLMVFNAGQGSARCLYVHPAPFLVRSLPRWLSGGCRGELFGPRRTALAEEPGPGFGDSK